MKKHALIVGASGLIGRQLAEYLAETGGWEVTGLSRHGRGLPGGVTPVAVDLNDAAAVARALKPVSPSHVFITAWSRQATEAENCRVNGAMVSNLLAALNGKAIAHVALVTGLKHYMGPFEAYARSKPVTPFREEQPRLPYENFYYSQEDVVFAGAKQQGYSWSVHRPHTLIGYAVGNAMNMAGTLCAYAAICRETGLPFVFPGSPEQFVAAVDVTDGRILAQHLAWAVATPAAANAAFNVVNGEVFRWNWLWPKLADYFGMEPAPYPGHASPLERSMAGMEPVWDRIVARHGLKPNPLADVASWWHSDADLGRTIENFTDMTKSRDLGFLCYQNTLRSFIDAFGRLRQERIVP